MKKSQTPFTSAPHNSIGPRSPRGGETGASSIWRAASALLETVVFTGLILLLLSDLELVPWQLLLPLLLCGGILGDTFRRAKGLEKNAAANYSAYRRAWVLFVLGAVLWLAALLFRLARLLGWIGG